MNNRFYANVPLPVVEPFLRRERLFAMLDQAFARSLVSVHGGQGAGKTALVAGYVKERRLPTVWVALDAGPAPDDERVFQALRNGLSQLGAAAPEGDEIDVLDRLAAWPERLAVVLDYGHAAPSTRMLELLPQLLQLSSRSVTYAVITRQRLQASLAALKAQRRVAECIPEDLAFEPGEIREYLRCCGWEPDEAQAGRIHRQTGGWALSLPWLADARERRGDPFRSLDELLGELLSAQNDPASADAMDALSRLSVLHELDDGMAGFLDAADREQLRRLREDGRFYLLRGEDGAALRLLPIVRDYLYRRLLRLQGPEAAAALHAKAAAACEERHRHYAAFAHRLAAGQYPEAARLMQVMMNFYTLERFLLLLDGSLEALCPSISIPTVSMFLFRSVPIPVLRSFVPGVEAAIARLESEGPQESLVQLQHRLGLILFYAGEVEQAQVLFARALAAGRQLPNPQWTIINLSLLAQCCRFAGTLAEGIGYAREALSAIESSGDYDARMHTVWILAELLLEQGELELAAPVIETLMKLSAQYADQAARVYPQLIEAKYARLRGELDEALRLAEAGVAAAEAYDIDPDLGWACLERGRIHVARGERQEAERYLARSAGYFEHYRHFHGMVTADLAAVRGDEPAAVPDEPAAAVSGFPMQEEPGKLHLQLLGPLRMTIGGQELKLPRKSSLFLLLHLALARGKKTPRDQLLEALFPDGDYLSQSNRFYVALSTLRKALEPELPSGRMSAFVRQSGETFDLDESACAIDLDAFERLAAPAPEASGESAEARAARLLEAEKLYRGDLLEEYPYEEMFAAPRERARHTYLQVLGELGRYYWEIRDDRSGIAYFERLLACDPYAEDVYWAYIGRLSERGLLRSAGEVAGRMVRQLERELGVPVLASLRARFPDVRPET